MLNISGKIFEGLSSLKHFIDKRAEEFGAPYFLFGVFGVINYPASYLFLKAIGPVEDFYLRLIATFLCISLVCKDFWPARVKPYLSVWWFFCILYCIPFFGVFMLLKNHYSMEWLINDTVGLFLLVLIVDWLSFLILLSLGIFFGVMIYDFMFGLESIDSTNLDFALYMYGSVMLLGVIFSRQKQKFGEEKLQSLQTLGATIAHEMRTPLTTIKNGALGIKKNLPALLETYEIAKAAGLTIPKILPKTINMLGNALDFIQKETDSASLFIDMQLANFKQSNINENTPKSLCQAKQLIESALARYPFSAEQQKLLHLDLTNNFSFMGNPDLLEHVLFNLLKNAYYFIAAANKGEIYIFLSSAGPFHELHFKDTGPGISKDKLPLIFKRFFSDRQYGTGVGLSFCQTVMRALGGKIGCFSEEGSYTEFVLYFPVLP